MSLYPERMPSQDDNPELEARLTRILERRADPPIPADFAARVTASLPAPRRPRRTARVARTTSLAAIFILAVAMFALAPHAAPTFGSLAFDAEMLVIAELGGIAYWLTTRRGT